MCGEMGFLIDFCQTSASQSGGQVQGCGWKPLKIRTQDVIFSNGCTPKLSAVAHTSEKPAMPWTIHRQNTESPVQCIYIFHVSTVLCPLWWPNLMVPAVDQMGII